MILYELAGLGLAASLDLGEITDDQRLETHKLLVVAAESFFLGGGVLTLTDWRGLDELERAAMIVAQKQVALRNIRLHLLASTGSLAELVAEFDPLEGAEVAMAQAVKEAGINERSWR